MMGHNPRDFPAHKRSDHFGRHPVMIAGRQPISDVMEQCANDPIRICPVPAGTGCGLQRVFKACDAIALEGLIPLSAQLCQNPFNGERNKGPLQLFEQKIVLFGAIFHLRKADCGAVLVHA